MLPLNTKTAPKVMYSALLGSLDLCETAFVTGLEVSTGARLAVASRPSLSLVATSVCDRVQEGLRANTLFILLIV